MNTATIVASKGMAQIEQPFKLALRPNEVAVALGISRARVFEMLARGEIRSIKQGRSRIVPISALEEWLSRELSAQSGEVA